MGVGQVYMQQVCKGWQAWSAHCSPEVCKVEGVVGLAGAQGVYAGAG